MIDDTKIIPEEQAVSEVATEETETVQPVEAPAVEEKKVEVSETEQQKNFRNLRAAKERAEREREEMARRLQEIESKTQAAQPEEEININADDLVEGKHLKQVGRKIKALEDQVKQYQQQSFAYSVEARLKAQFNDFDKVVTQDNIDLLKEAEPELAATIGASSDMYSKAVSVYKMIKQMGIYKDSAPYAADKAKIQANATKPRSSASVSPQQGESPLHQANAFANGLSDELKAQLIKEMQEARKGY